MIEYLKGRYITVCKTYYLITHVRGDPLHYPLVRHSLYSIFELHESLYKPHEECMTSNMTRAFYDSEIQRLFENGFLTDNLSVLKELNEDISKYDRLVDMLCKLNVHFENHIQYCYILRKEKYTHIFGLIILSGTPIYTNV